MNKGSFLSCDYCFFLSYIGGDVEGANTLFGATCSITSAVASDEKYLETETATTFKCAHNNGHWRALASANRRQTKLHELRNRSGTDSDSNTIGSN